MTPSDLLNRAADFLEKGKKGDGECAVTALVASMPMPEDSQTPTHDWDVYVVAREKLCQAADVPNKPVDALHRWHDHPRRTRKQVVETFRKAART